VVEKSVELRELCREGALVESFEESLGIGRTVEGVGGDALWLGGILLSL
jgi:hypothetical protein